jgi:hypothetical protein
MSTAGRARGELMATREVLQAAVDAIRRTDPGWMPSWQVQMALDRLPHGAQVSNKLVDDVRKTAPLGVFGSNGQIRNPPRGAPSVALPAPNSADATPPRNIPGPPHGTSPDTTVEKPYNDLHDPDKFTGKLKPPKNVPYDPVPSFIDGYNAMKDVTESGPGKPGWNRTISGVKSELSDALNTLDGAIEGEFGDSLRNNVKQSFGALDDMSNHAQAMEHLFQAFFNDLKTTKDNFVKNVDAYNEAIRDQNKPANKETVNRLNAFAVNVMKEYRPPVDDIAGRHPSVSTALPAVGPTEPGPAGAGGGSSGGPNGATPEGLQRGGRNTGMPADAAQPQQRAGAPAMPQVPTNALQGAADGAQQAAGQAADAAKKALGDALKGAQKAHAELPEGALGLGPKGLAGLAKTGGTGSAHGGGGAGRRDPPLVRPVAKVAAPGKPGGAAVPVSRAGLSGAGSPGAGVPAAGHRAGAADKEHRASKALRHTKHGAEVIGEADAVAPVIGEKPRKAAPPQPGTQ